MVFELVLIAGVICVALVMFSMGYTDLNDYGEEEERRLHEHEH